MNRKYFAFYETKSFCFYARNEESFYIMLYKIEVNQCLCTWKLLSTPRYKDFCKKGKRRRKQQVQLTGAMLINNIKRMGIVGATYTQIELFIWSRNWHIKVVKKLTSTPTCSSLLTAIWRDEINRSSNPTCIWIILLSSLLFCYMVQMFGNKLYTFPLKEKFDLFIYMCRCVSITVSV